MTGGSLFTSTDFASGVSLRLSSTASSGTLLVRILGNAAVIFCSSWAARAVSSAGKCDASSFGSDRITEWVAMSVVVAKETSRVPRIGVFWPGGVMETAARAVSFLWSGHEIACGS